MASPPSWMMWDCSRLHLQDVRQDSISTGESAIVIESLHPPARAAPARHRGMLGVSLLDHPISPGEQRWRNRQSERLGGLEVDNQLERGGLLDGEIGRLGTLEDLVHVGSGAPI